MYTKHAELKAGILVLAATAALLWFLFYATGADFLKSWAHISLRVQSGRLAPKEGDAVYLNGVMVGQIESIRWESETRRGAELTEADREDLPEGVDLETAVVHETYVLAEAKVEKDLPFTDTTLGKISESLTGSVRVDLLTGTGARRSSDAAGTPIVVQQVGSIADAADSIDALASDLSSVTGDVRDAVKSAQAFLEEARGLVASIEKKVDAFAIEAISSEVEAAARALRTTIDTIAARVGTITGNLDEATADLRKIGAAGARLADRLEADIAEIAGTLKQVSTKLDGILDRAAPRIDSLLESVDAAAKNIGALTDELSGIGPEVRAVIASAGTDVDEILETVKDVGLNLLDASEDIRAHPWKLLNEPSTDQIAYENLRNAMLNYVRAMRQMDSTAKTLRQLLQTGVASPEDRARFQRTLAEFESSGDRYRRMEQRLLELLEQNAAPGAPR